MLLARCSAQELVDVKAACESDLLAFTALFFRARMNMEFLVNWHHEHIVDSLMAVYRGEIKNLCINMPPGGTKTELAVIHFMAWCLARDPYCRFLHLSGADDLAALNSATTKEIIELEEYQALWPTILRRNTRAKKRWNVEVNGKTAGGVYATSTGGQLTGFRAGYIRDGFSGAIIIDDPLKADDTWSMAKREAANRKLTGTIRSRRASTENTPIILIMQRLHEDDPAAHALAGDFAVTFEHLEIQAVLNEGGGDDEGAGERSYWPAKESLTSLTALRDKDPYTFYAQYQQNPTPPGGAMIKTDWIVRYEVPPKVLSVGIFADTAMKTGQHNDFSVLLLAGTDGHNAIIVDIVRDKLEAPDLLEAAKTFWLKHRPNRITNPVRFAGLFIEDKASGTGLIQTLRRETDAPIIPLQRATDKVSRLNDVLPYIRAGRLWVPAHAPWASTYLGELASFSPAMTHSHDDQVDVTVDAINELLSPGGGLFSGADWS